MGGSMGSVVGEKVARSIEAAIAERRALIVVSATGGARHAGGHPVADADGEDLGAARAASQDARLPFVSILTDPSTAGVLASFASLGDVIVAEPGALVGFAGARVIRQTIGEDLPAGLPARRVRAREGFHRPHRSPQADARGGRRACSSSSGARRAGSPPEGQRSPHRLSRRSLPGGRRHGSSGCPDSVSLKLQHALEAALRSRAPPGQARPRRHSGAARGTRSSRAALPRRARRRHQRQGLDLRDRRARAARRRSPHGTLHLAAPGRLPRAHPRERPLGGRGLRSNACSTASRPCPRGVTAPSSRRARRSRSRRSRPKTWSGRWSRSASAAASTRPTCIVPELSVITTIGFDHEEILGHTLERIAAEKAGIVKPGVPVVESAGSDAARAVIGAIAAECHAEVLPPRTSPRRTPRSRPKRRVPDRGLRHAALGARAGRTHAGAQRRPGARGALRPRAPRHPHRGARCARGRERGALAGTSRACPSDPRLWWDGAHNPEGVAAVARVWQEAGIPAPAAVVLAVSRDKRIDRMLEALASFAAGRPVIATRSRSERAMSVEHVAAAAESCGFPPRSRPTSPRPGASRSRAPRPSVPRSCSARCSRSARRWKPSAGAPGEWQ